MPLVTKLAAASKAVGGKLKADKTNTEQRYDYVSADAILVACGQAIADAGIVIFPAIVGSAVDVFQTANNKTRYDARVDYIFTIADDTESKDFVWLGLGSDYTVPDKAIYKAITSGHRYFLAKLLNVGEDNEDGEHAPGEDIGAGTTKRILEAAPNCPKCGGKMWDNREGKKNPKAPDFKCRNKTCDGAIWQDATPAPAAQPAPGNGNGHAPEAIMPMKPETAAAFATLLERQASEPTAAQMFDDMTSATQERAAAETHDSGTMATIDGAVATKFSKWCEKFAEAYPSYRKNGTADKFNILKAVKAEKFDRITTENVTAVCDALRARAEAKVAAGAGK